MIESKKARDRVIMNVLVVSDEQEILTRLERILAAQRQLKSLHWANWNEAQPAIRTLNPDLVLVRLSRDMPQYTELCQTRQLTASRIAIVGSGTDAQGILRALRCGADDYLDESRVEEDLRDTLQRAALGRQSVKLGKMIAIVGCSGGCGASTLAVNLAAALTRQAGKTLLVDLKLECGDLAALLDLLPGHTLRDLCAHADRLDENLLLNAFAEHESGMALLASPRKNASIIDRLGQRDESSRPDPHAVEQVLERSRGLFPWLVADVDAHIREEHLAALQMADLVLAVMRLDFVSLKNARRMLEHLHWLGIEEKRIRCIANRTGQPREVPQVKAEEALHARIVYSLPDDPPAVNRAINHGVPAVLGEPKSKVARSAVQLTQMIQKELG